MFTLFTRTDIDLDLFLDTSEIKTDAVSQVHEEYYARSSRQLQWNPPDDQPRKPHSVFDEPRKEPKKPPPLPCVTFTRSQVLLYNLRSLGYDLSQVAANDNGQARLAMALEVALCHKRGLLEVDDIAAALGQPVDAVRTAANDLNLAARTG